MNRRSQTIWVLLVTLSFLFLVLIGFRFYPIHMKYKQIEKRALRAQFGTDKELEDIIEYLESRLESRVQYDFTLENEPLRLQNVLYLYDTYGRRLQYHDSKKLRVTAVFIGGSQPQALMNYHDMNYTVMVGDSIGGGEVMWIDEEEVVFLKDDIETHYPVAIITNSDDGNSDQNN